MSDPGIIIGDVHGCIATLEALLGKLPKGRDIYFTGDLVDRGRHSDKVIQLVIDLDLKSIIGNHEHMMLCAYRKIRRDPYFDSKALWRHKQNGGEETVKSYEGKEDLLKSHLCFIKSLPYYRTIPIPQTWDGRNNLLITHSGVNISLEKDMINIKRSDKRMYSHAFESFLWNSNDPANIPDTYCVIGHNIVKMPVITRHYALIDGGCVLGGKLFAIDMSDFRVFEQKCKDDKFVAPK